MTNKNIEFAERRGRKLKIGVGEVFGEWVVLGASANPKYPNAQYLECACSCGNIRSVGASALSRGKTTHCGCTRRQAHKDRVTIHGMYETPTYNSFTAMNNRCNRSSHREYHRYGGNGVMICDRWNLKAGGSFLNFLEDMGERPVGHTLNRVNGAKIYAKDTCEWATAGEQSFDQKLRKDNTSGRTGVSRLGEDKYYATIQVGGKVKWLGTFTEFEIAVKAREDAELKYYGFIKEA